MTFDAVCMIKNLEFSKTKKHRHFWIDRPKVLRSLIGKFHDQGDAKWIVIRGQLRGHNDTPFGRPTLGWPIGRPQGVFGGISYY
jgi:hypothetical protein